MVEKLLVWVPRLKNFLKIFEDTTQALWDIKKVIVAISWPISGRSNQGLEIFVFETESWLALGVVLGDFVGP